MTLEEASKTIGFGPEALWTFLAVLIALMGIALLVMNLIKTGKELRQGKVEKGKTVMDMLNNDNKRIGDLEAQAKKQDTELMLILRAQVAMLHHMVDGNNTENLKRSQHDIEEYLLTGRVNQ